jgi:RNA-binding protein
MALNSRRRRELLTRAHGLSPVVTVAAERLAPAVVEQVRSYLSQHELAKVRIRAADRQACDRAAAELARLVPCELVARVGRVAIFYRPAEQATAD